MLYLAKLLNQDPELRFRYIDDICLYRVSPLVYINVTLLVGDVRSVLEYRNEHKIFFILEKLEMIYFTRKRHRESLAYKVNNDLIITLITTLEKEGE